MRTGAGEHGRRLALRVANGKRVLAAVGEQKLDHLDVILVNRNVHRGPRLHRAIRPKKIG